MAYKCEYCGQEAKDQYDLEVNHRVCRLKAAFPGAYTEKGDGIVAFDTKKMVEALGLFDDIIIGRDGQDLHPLDGDIHFRIGAGWIEPEIWIEMPVQVGNQLSSFSYRISPTNWTALTQRIDAGLKLAWKHIIAKRDKEAAEKEADQMAQKDCSEK